ncbi:MAG: peptidoglycan DD-metalloendopeptidase family protein [Burkholderiaceae bacterium]
MPRIPDPRFNRIALAIAATLTFAAVTAFGVAPLGDTAPPAPETIIEALPLAPEVVELPDRFVQTERIRRGETLASLLERLGAADADFLRFVTTERSARRLVQLYAGRSVTAETDALGRVLSLQYRYGNLSADGQESATRLTIRRTDEGGFVATDEPVPLDRHTAMAAVTINTSLFAATDAAGVPDSIASKVADILDGEIDFRRDLRRGAELRILYETVREADSLDAPIGSRVLAVELINDGKRHDAVWFERKQGKGEYFGFDGRSMRKTFLRSPIEFSRVSSGFSNARLHPVFGTVRAHKGTDFAAPAGTPVRAAGEGVVSFVGTQRGYGNVVILQHRNGVETLYAHLRSFAPGLRRQARIDQGDIIGQVGSTGWATGPHLHYEFKVNGQHKNPMTVAMPDSAPLSPAERERFAAQTDQLTVQLAQLDPLRVAASFE